ncbi:MAG: histidine phosphatase family protein [Chlamydiae bacterium]|nr:histidine phosphatase family protein [Chlamydiota bacterium]
MRTKRIFLVRHGETPWSLSGQHTGKTDLSLTEEGCRQASLLGSLLQGLGVSKAFISPLKRAKETFDLSGLRVHAELDHDLVEWDYGDYEGRTSKEIHKDNPSWDLFTEGAPRGEKPEAIVQRASRTLQKALSTEGDVIFFSSGHILRSIAAIWLKAPLVMAKHLVLSPASLSQLGYEHEHPAIFLWNRTLLP